MNADTLVMVLKDNIGFDGGANELYKRLLAHRSFRNAPYVPSGTTFVEHLQMLVGKSNTTGLEITFAPNGRVRIESVRPAEENPDEQTLLAKLRAEYNASSDLRREFRTFESYSAYQRGVVSGRISQTAGLKGRNVIDEGRTVSANVDTRLPIEERCRQRWAVEPATRKEFHENFAAFVAYEKANAKGQVRQLRSVAG
jgi:hypothetical protein